MVFELGIPLAAYGLFALARPSFAASDKSKKEKSMAYLDRVLLVRGRE